MSVRNNQKYYKTRMHYGALVREYTYDPVTRLFKIFIEARGDPKTDARDHVFDDDYVLVEVIDCDNYVFKNMSVTGISDDWVGWRPPIGYVT